MKIAVASNGLSVSANFSTCSNCNCYTIKDNKIADTQNIPTVPKVRESLPTIMKEFGISVLITGSIPEEIHKNFSEKGIKVVDGQSGHAIGAVQKYITQ